MTANLADARNGLYSQVKLERISPSTPVHIAHCAGWINIDVKITLLFGDIHCDILR